MRKKLAAATTALVAAFALCSAAVPAQAASLSGSGTQADPYLIANAEDLAQFRDIVNEGGDIYSTNAKLTADIDLQGSTWVPIGLDNASPFYGSFDGQGHVIRNMHVDMSNEEAPAGLFSEVFGSIHNLGVLNATVTGTDMVGAIAGSIENSDDGTGLFNCWSDGGTVTGRSMVGGLVAICAQAAKRLLPAPTTAIMSLAMKTASAALWAGSITRQSSTAIMQEMWKPQQASMCCRMRSAASLDTRSTATRMS
ncbi:hypothetical protein [Bifidobacterium mongoliense]|uniref:hypothetical protein n=1 Tax=Bifidobacterium mongoliense TaxID=518643 RepID=UPI0030EEEEDA